MTDTIALAAAVFSAIATGCAAFATWSAPRSAAQLAESLRRDAERQNERQKLKLHVFSTLMQERAQIHSDEGVRALNLSDIVFNETLEVRESWSELFLAFQMKPTIQHVIDERLRKLLASIAKDVGLADQLRNDDLGRVYYPIVQAQEQFIRDMQRQQILRSLQGQNVASATATAIPNSMWPPKP
jgi:Flp pilus assembly protein CpaB